ncbi:receptor-like protein kinase [Gossypium australe]|uniref:Receptor-like protein kinase n=1 Tax=Gossypium australe TaxID=47621 RepID=A0A5B6USY4_9ROSI|nr:receptor-like protein kinase [Gossypium australe]
MKKSYTDLKRKDIKCQVGDKRELEKVHNVFHVSMLRRYRSDLSYVISPFDCNMSYSEKSIRIFAREVRELRNKCIALVKVL